MGDIAREVLTGLNYDFQFALLNTVSFGAPQRRCLRECTVLHSAVTPCSVLLSTVRTLLNCSTLYHTPLCCAHCSTRLYPTAAVATCHCMVLYCMYVIGDMCVPEGRVSWYSRTVLFSCHRATLTHTQTLTLIHSLALDLSVGGASSWPSQSPLPLGSVSLRRHTATLSRPCRELQSASLYRSGRENCSCRKRAAYLHSRHVHSQL
jgi:hypothetical protein